MGIRVVPNDPTPKRVYRVLLPNERPTVAVRFHPVVVVVPLVVASGGLIAAVVLSVQGLSARALEITWSIWGLAFLYGVLRALDWLSSYYVMTRDRIILVKGGIRSDVATLPVSAVALLRFRRSAPGKLLGYGQLILQGTGGWGRLRVSFLPYPEQLYLELVDLLFPERKEGG